MVEKQIKEQIDRRIEIESDGKIFLDGKEITLEEYRAYRDGKEQGEGSNRQIRPPTDSDSLHPPKLCIIDNCDGEVLFKGLCSTHYYRERNNLRNIKANKKCLCGCGQPVDYRCNYARGHNTKITKHLRMTGDKNNQWKGGRHEAHGYVFIYMPDHPNANVNKYVREHHLIMEGIIERYIDMDTEVVHHINFIKNDNRPENLHLCNKREHHSIHKTIFLLIKDLLQEEAIEFDRKEGKYIIKERII